MITVILSIIIFILLIAIITLNDARKEQKKRAIRYDDWLREEQKQNRKYHTMSIAFTDTLIDDIIAITYLDVSEDENKKVLRVLTKSEEKILTINKETINRYTPYSNDKKD